MQKAVENSKVPFDSKLDVLVHCRGKKGKGVSLMELACYNTHILNKQVTLNFVRGWTNIHKEGYHNGIHRLVLGLKTGDKT